MTVVWLALVLAAIGGWGVAGSWAFKWLAHVELRSLQDVLPLGLALLLAVAGVVVAFDVFSPTVVALIVAVGVACALVELARWALTGHGPVHERIESLGLGTLLAGAVLLVARWQTASFVWNPFDDDVGYLYLARRLVLEGNLLDPLNNRRLTSLGGMSALQALFLFRLPDSYLPIADLLIGSLLVLVALWRTRSERWSVWGIAAAFTVIFFHGSLGAGNTSPVLIPVGLMLAAFLFAVRLRAEAVAPRAEVATAGVLGLLVGAAATLRPQYGVPLGLLALVAVTWPPLGSGFVRRLAGMAAGGAVATAGWMVASWRAVGTPMFPIFSGNLDPTWPANGPAVGVPSVTALGGRVFAVLASGHWWGLALVVALYITVSILREVDDNRTHIQWGVRMHVAATAIVVAWVAVLAYMWWALGSPTVYPRFWAPLFLACVLIPIALMNGGQIHRRAQSAASGLAAVAVVAIVTGVVAATPREAANYVLSAATDTMSGRVSSQLEADRYATRRDEYAMAAARIPAGSRVLAAVDVPSLLLSGGFELDTIDLVGSTSPPPHLPYFQGTEAKLQWLRAHGYRYIIAVDPDASAGLYSRSAQEYDLKGEARQPYQAWAPYYFDWFQLVGDVSSRPGSAGVGSLIVARV